MASRHKSPSLWPSRSGRGWFCSAARERRTPEAEWLDGLHDETELKRALLARSDRFRTPQELGEESRRVMVRARDPSQPCPDRRGRLAGRLSLSRRAGPGDGSGTLKEIRGEFGPIRGLIHGAGVLADRRITDQTDVAVRASLRHQGQGSAQSDRRNRSRFALVPGPVLVIDGPVWPDRPSGLRGRERSAQQVGAATTRSAAALSRRLVQLGPLGRGNGQRRAQGRFLKRKD